MTSDFQRLRVPRAGSESFHVNSRALAFALSDFWSWSTSDLVSNATRGKLAEFIVSRAIGITGQPVRDEWAPCDLLTDDGIRIEVKSAAYVQSWHQKAHSPIVFSIRRHGSGTRTQTIAPKSSSELLMYMFSLFSHILIRPVLILSM